MNTPNPIDLQTPFDATGFTEITAAQLEQLVAGSSPANGIGFIVITVDSAGLPNVPDASVTTKWQSYMWVRVSTNFVTGYLWNPGGNVDVTYLNWVTISSASIGPGTIQGYQIAALTISDTNILNVSSSKITGGVVAAWLAQLNLGQTAYATNGLVQNNFPAFGDLTGSTIGSPVVAPLAITQTKLALQSVGGDPVAATGQIIDNSITTLQLLNNGSGASTPLLTAAVDPANNVLISTKSIPGLPSTTNFNPAVSGVNVAAGDTLAVNVNAAGTITGLVLNRRALLTLSDPSVQTYEQVPIVAVGATTYSLANSNAVGRILQKVSSTITAAITPIAILAIGNAITGANSTQLFKITNFVPLSANSTVSVKVAGFFSQLTNSANQSIGILKVATGNSAAGASPDSIATTNANLNVALEQVVHEQVYTLGSVAGIDIYVIAVTTATATTFNKQAGYTGVNNTATVEVTEYL